MRPLIRHTSEINALHALYQEASGIASREEPWLLIHPHNLLQNTELMHARYASEQEHVHLLSDLEASVGPLLYQSKRDADWKGLSIWLNASSAVTYDIHCTGGKLKMRPLNAPELNQPGLFDLGTNLSFVASLDTENSALLDAIYNNWKQDNFSSDCDLNIRDLLKSYAPDCTVSVLKDQMTSFIEKLSTGIKSNTTYHSLFADERLARLKMFQDVVREKWLFTSEGNAIQSIAQSLQSDDVLHFLEWKQQSTPGEVSLEFLFDATFQDAWKVTGINATGWQSVDYMLPICLTPKVLDRFLPLCINGKKLESSYRWENYLPNLYPDFLYGAQPFKFLKMRLRLDHYGDIIIKIEDLRPGAQQYGCLLKAAEYE